VSHAGKHKIVALNGHRAAPHILGSLTLLKVGRVGSQQLLEVGYEMSLPGNSKN
jgi:hypothetical protein